MSCHFQGRWVVRYLDMSVNEVVELKVVVVLAEGVDQCLGDLQPPNVEDELKAQKYGDVQIQWL